MERVDPELVEILVCPKTRENVELASVEIVEKIKRHAKKQKATVIDIAIGWLLNNSAVTSLVAGPRTMEQWEAYVKALEYKFLPEDEALIEKFVPSGHPSSPGYNDPAYPIEGRYRIS